MWPLMGPTTPPLSAAFNGETSTKEAMSESARQVNELFGRPPGELALPLARSRVPAGAPAGTLLRRERHA